MKSSKFLFIIGCALIGITLGVASSTLSFCLSCLGILLFGFAMVQAHGEALDHFEDDLIRESEILEAVTNYYEECKKPQNEVQAKITEYYRVKLIDTIETE